MEEQAYSQANTREPIQVIDVDGWRSSIRHYEDLGESFDWTQKRKDRNSEEMFSNELNTRHRSEEYENTKRKRSLSLSSSDESVEVNRIHISKPSHENMGPMHTFYKAGQSCKGAKDQLYPFEDRIPRTHSPNRLLYEYTDEKLISSKNFEEDARRMLEAPLKSQKRSRSRRRKRSRSSIGMSSDIEEGEIESDEEIYIDSDKTTDMDQSILGVVKQERNNSFSMALNVKCETLESCSTSNEKENSAVIFLCKEEYIEQDEIKKELIVKPEPKTCLYFNTSEIGQDNEQTRSKNFEEINGKKLRASISLGDKLVKQSGIATRTTHIGLSSDIEEGEIVSDEENCIDSQENKYIIQGILDVVKHERLHSFPTFSNVKCEAPELSSANIREKTVLCSSHVRTNILNQMKFLKTNQ